MGMEVITGAIFNTRQHLEALFKDRTLKQDRWPGFKAILVYQAVITALCALAAWVGLALVAVLVHLIGWRLGGFARALSGLWASFLSPFSLVGSFVQGAALLAVSVWSFTEVLDRLFQRLQNHRGGQALWVFNVWLWASLPWCLFLLIPVLGAFVALGGTLWVGYLVLSHAYGEKDWVKLLVNSLAACVPAALATWVLAWMLGVIAQPLSSLDPTRAWFGSLADRAMAPPAEPAQALAEAFSGGAPAGQTTGNASDEQAAREALRMVAANPQFKSMQAALLKEAQERQMANNAAGAVAAPAPRQATSAVPVAAPPAHAPKAAPVPAAQAPTAPAEPAPVPAAAVQPTEIPVIPTPVPTSVAGAVGKAVAADAVLDGVGQAVKLIKLFH